MTENALLQCTVYFVLLTAAAIPLGIFIKRVLAGNSGRLERTLLRAAGTDPAENMSWSKYALAVLVFNFLGMLVVYVFQRMQGFLPLNPQSLGPVNPAVAFNTASSFATNTNWQTYGGETTLSDLTQMAVLTVQNFVSAASGIAVMAALARGFTRRLSTGIGNFWVDLTRITLFILLPLSFILAIALLSQGVVQTIRSYPTAALIDPGMSSDGTPVTEQLLAVGPVASQVAIKQLGTNGGGFFNVNSAHPFENPTPVSNLLELLSILLIPAALCFTFGEMVQHRRHGAALYTAMLVIFIPLLLVAIVSEQNGNPWLSAHGIDASFSKLQPGGNMEGKDVRFGIVSSALWAAATTAASNGSVNSMHDSFTPLGGLVPMGLIQLGEVVFGGVGSGLYGMLMFVIVAVFIAGLMVGRTPEYLGKKLEAFEMKMASLVILIPAAAVLIGTAIACVVPAGTATLGNPGAHGFSEILYAFSSGANNNGSAFGGITVSGMFYATAIGIAMILGRYWLMVPVLAIAGSLAAKKYIPPSAGTLPTHTPLFVMLLVGTVLLVGALTFIPALALGPIVEHLQRGAP